MSHPSHFFNQEKQNWQKLLFLIAIFIVRKQDRHPLAGLQALSAMLLMLEEHTAPISPEFIGKLQSEHRS